MVKGPAHLITVILEAVMRIGTLFLLLGLFAAPLGAQGPAPVGLHQVSSPVPSKPSHTATNARDSIPHSYWRTGMIAGGALGLIGAFQLRHGFDGEESNVPFTSWVTLVAVFSLIGGMIGSMIH